VYNLGKLWEKTGDVEKLRSRAGRGESLDDYMEQALVEIFSQNVNIIMDEAHGGLGGVLVEWPSQGFSVTHKRLKLSSHSVILRFEQITYYAWRASMVINWSS
jgi:hypothetical protein